MFWKTFSVISKSTRGDTSRETNTYLARDEHNSTHHESLECISHTLVVVADVVTVYIRGVLSG